MKKLIEKKIEDYKNTPRFDASVHEIMVLLAGQLKSANAKKAPKKPKK